MSLTAVAERHPKATHQAPKEALQVTWVREQLIGRFLKNYNGIANAVNDWNNQRIRELTKKNGGLPLLRTEISASNMKRIVIDSISKDDGSIDLLYGEEKLYDLFMQITSKEKAVDRMVETHIPNAVKKLLVLYMFDGNTEQAGRVAERFGMRDCLNWARTKAIEYNTKAERDSMMVDLICTTVAITPRSHEAPLVSFIRRPLFEAKRPFFQNLD